MENVQWNTEEVEDENSDCEDLSKLVLFAALNTVGIDFLFPEESLIHSESTERMSTETHD